MKIIVLHSDVSAAPSLDEQDTLIQAQTVENTLREMGHDVSTLPFTADQNQMADRFHSECPDLVFNLVESVGGQGKLIHLAPAMLDSLELKYTGCSTNAIYFSTNKIFAKRFFYLHGIPTPSWITFPALQAFRPVIHSPYIIKAIWEHASVGLDEDSVVYPSDYEQLYEEMEKRSRVLGEEIFAESYIDGREFNLALLDGPRGVEVLPPAEMLFEGYSEEKVHVVGYRAKWVEDSYEFHHTPRRFDFPAKDKLLIERLCSIARYCWKVFRLGGYARIDFRVDRMGQPWVLEVNTNPCISPDAGFLASAQQATYTMQDVIERIIQSAVSSRLHCYQEIV